MIYPVKFLILKLQQTFRLAQITVLGIDDDNVMPLFFKIRHKMPSQKSRPAGYEYVHVNHNNKLEDLHKLDYAIYLC